MNVIVISLGGLRVHYLGCYGGAWVETPALDRFAAEGFVFDECFVETPSPAATRQAWWTGCYRNFYIPDEPERSGAGHPSLIRTLRSCGIRTVLVRDSHTLVEDPRGDSSEFDQIIGIDRCDEDASARVFKAAMQWMKQEAARGRFLLFIDCHGAHRPWYLPDSSDDSDAELEEIDADQEVNEDAADIVEIDSNPAREASEAEGATERARQAYAAVVSHLDSELGSFFEFLRGRPDWEQSLVMITSDCGASLDEQHTAMLGRSDLHEGRTHVPLLVRMPGAHDPATRSPALVQSIDLMPTVCDGLGVEIPPDVHGHTLLPIVRLQVRSVRDHALMADAGRAWAIRTPAWNLMLPLAAAGSELPPETQLFVKPDDRWDRNDVAKQFPDVAEQLEQALRRHVVLP